MESTEGRVAEGGGCRPEGKGVCYWWTCSARLWHSGREHGGSWGAPVALVSWENWNSETSWNLMEKDRNKEQVQI